MLFSYFSTCNISGSDLCSVQFFFVLSFISLWVLVGKRFFLGRGVKVWVLFLRFFLSFFLHLLSLPFFTGKAYGKKGGTTAKCSPDISNFLHFSTSIFFFFFFSLSFFFLFFFFFYFSPLQHPRFSRLSELWDSIDSIRLPITHYRSSNTDLTRLTDGCWTPFKRYPARDFT
ncbi:hypothetical protein BZA77DRAFT_111183 [Pyronema omphalodes]|nr:hypothetical protein BZA77DRAFT_111183 [Pyronema omphalodes]